MNDFKNSLYRIHALIDGDPKIIQFVDYTEKHRQKVMDLMRPFDLTKRAWLHDMDKYEPNRMRAYAEHFYGDKTPEIEDAFEEAWKSHMFNNEHHPQYWYNKDRVMPFEVWVEMISDWISAGICTHDHYNSKDTLDYYLNDDRHILDNLPLIKEATEDFLKVYAEDMSNFNPELLKRIYSTYIK